MTIGEFLARAMRLGLGHLRLAPRDVWSMSLIEYDAATRGYLESKGVNVDAGMTRKRFDELLALYPDEPQAS